MSPFRRASHEDAHAIAALINAAYSGEAGAAGWTHEGHILTGNRTDGEEIRQLLAAPDIAFYVLPTPAEIAGCAYVKRMEGGTAYLGLLAVRPLLQGAGIGSRLIAEGERIAREQWRCARVALTAITRERPELASFYERRGYVRTGWFEPLVRKDARAKSKVAGLEREWLVKSLELARTDTSIERMTEES